MDEFLKKQERSSSHIQRAYENLRRFGQANITRGVIKAKISVLDTKWDDLSKCTSRLRIALQTRMKRDLISLLNFPLELKIRIILTRASFSI